MSTNILFGVVGGILGGMSGLGISHTVCKMFNVDMRSRMGPSCGQILVLMGTMLGIGIGFGIGISN